MPATVWQISKAKGEQLPENWDKIPPKEIEKNSSNWLIIDMPATAKSEQLPETENAENCFRNKSWNHNKRTKAILFLVGFRHMEPLWATVNQKWKKYLFLKLYNPFTGHFEKHQPQLCPMHHSQSREEGRQDQRRTCLGPTPLQRCLGGNQNLPTRFPQQVIN